jgi:hypothetical protein
MDRVLKVKTEIMLAYQAIPDKWLIYPPAFPKCNKKFVRSKGARLTQRLDSLVVFSRENKNAG